MKTNYLTFKSKNMNIRLLLTIGIFALLFFSCEKDDPKTENEVPKLIDYFPSVEVGTNWYYQVSFPARVKVPYRPVIVSPEKVLAASGICGTKSWNAGMIYFTIQIDAMNQSSTNTKKCDITISETGLEFYYNLSGDISTELQLNIDNNTAQYDIVASLFLNTNSVTGTGELSLSEMLDYMSHDYIISYRLANLAEEDLSQKYSITVPAGTFENCIKSVVNINGDGSYVPSGSYPVETYLAPDIGVVKAIGKDKDGIVLYTLELIDNNNDICESSDTECGTYSVCYGGSSYYLIYDGKKYYCDGEDCDQAIEELVGDMCDF